MTKEEFKKMQEEHTNSKLSLKSYLTGKNLSVPHYYYLKKKFNSNPLESRGQFLDITSKLNQNPDLSEVAVIYPNGIRINFRSNPGIKILLDLAQD